MGRILFGLHSFNGVSAVGGGLALMIGVIDVPVWVEATAFPDLYFPGVILMAVVGGSSLLAALAMAKRALGWHAASILAGVIMLFWVVGEIASIRGFHWLQVVYLITGIAAIWLTPAGPESARQ